MNEFFQTENVIFALIKHSFLPVNNRFRLNCFLRTACLLAVFFLFSSQKKGGIGDRPTWVSATSKTGDRPSDLLRRFGLDGHDCNLQQFLVLNNLSEKRRLPGGKTWFLPIQSVKYNGKSIRTTLLIDDLDVAVRIKKFNEKTLADGLRTDRFIESRNLWVPFHELGCTTTLGPPDGPADRVAKGKRVFPIFGKKLEKVPLKSSRLKGKVFYIVSGHGAADAGATAKLGKKLLCEDEYAYDVSLRLARKLLENGALTYIIVRDDDDGIRETEICACDSDEKLWGDQTIPASQKPRLFQRSNLLNELYEENKLAGLKDQTMVEIHVDSRSKSTSQDVFFYHKPDDKMGHKLANHVHKTFMLNYLQKRKRHYHGTLTGRDLHMLRESKMLGLYVELGNIRNVADQQRILKPANREALANWLFEGLSTFKK